MNSQKKILIFFLFFSFAYGSDQPKKKVTATCPKNYSCIVTYISSEAIAIYARNWQKEIIDHDGPAPLDPITLLKDKAGNFLEVEISKNVYYYKGFWKGKEILISRFDLDISKSLRTLGLQTIILSKEADPNSPLAGIVPKNILFTVKENTNPLSEQNGFVKIEYNHTVGWVNRTSLSNDPYDIRYHKIGIQEISKPYQFSAFEKDFSTKIRFRGMDFHLLECMISDTECQGNPRMGRSSFGEDQEAVYFDLTSKNGSQYNCEIRRADILDELERLAEEQITEEELTPFMNCAIKEEEEVKGEEESE